MPEPLALYLIRHGETDWSISGQHTGRTEIPLTARGEQQARNLGGYLRKISFTKVLSSPRVRARRTCELMNLDVPPSIDDDLAEWDYGAYEGLRTDEILRKNPHWNLWTDGCPDGEGPRDVAARCDRLLHTLRGCAGNIALFSHGHLCCALAARWIGLPIVNGQHFVLDPGSFGMLGFPEHHKSIPVIRVWNAAADVR